MRDSGSWATGEGWWRTCRARRDELAHRGSCSLGALLKREHPCRQGPAAWLGFQLRGLHSVGELQELGLERKALRVWVAKKRLGEGWRTSLLLRGLDDDVVASSLRRHERGLL